MNNQSTSSKSTDFTSLINQLQDTLDLYLVKKAPALPENIKDLIVKFSPYLSLLGVVIGIPALLTLLGLSAALSPFAMMNGYRYGYTFGLTSITSIASLVLEAFAVPGLFARSKSGWNFAFYAVLVNALGSLLSLQLFNLIIGAAISFYFLFQVRNYYK